MSRWVDEVEAAVDTVVHYVSSIETTLIRQVLLKLIVNVLDDLLEAGRQRIKLFKDQADLEVEPQSLTCLWC